MYRFAGMLLAAAAILACGRPARTTWTRRAADSTAALNPTGDPDYERQALSAFWGDMAFMNKCAPAGAPIAAPFDIYVEILPSGRTGRTLFQPETETAKCVRAYTADRRYPPPPSTFVLHIAMKFTP